MSHAHQAPPPATPPGPVRPWLSDAEVADLCEGLVTPSAQVRFLRRLGLTVERKPSGRVLLMRSELERVFGAGRFAPQTRQEAAAPGPNRAALLELVGGRRGSQAQGR